MKLWITLLMFTITNSSVFSQDHSKNYSLDTIVSYGLSFSRTGDSYFVEGKPVDKSVFYDLVVLNEKLDTCCSCLIQIRNKKDSVLRYEIEKCESNWVGIYNKYDSSENRIITGHYTKESPENSINVKSAGTGDRGNMTGDWLYLDENSDTTSFETWKNGIFVSQSNSDNSSEIWGYGASFNNASVDSIVVPVDSINMIKVHPFYKNINKSMPCWIMFYINYGTENHEFKYSLEEFKKVDFQTLFNNLEMQEIERMWVRLGLMTKESHYPPYVLKIKN